MEKVYFNCDYMAGAHPEVMTALQTTNLKKTVGYGEDEYTGMAREKILNACGLKEGEVFFLQGGTQTNKVVIDRLLSRNDGVVCCDSGHINVHEAGAIEADGHKVMAIKGENGKMHPDRLCDLLEDYQRDDTREHMVRPGMVYISHPTEFGTLYARKELSEISAICQRYGIPLYIDGARLAYALAAIGSDVSLHDIAIFADVFYIGGTKCGALFGEAVVTRHKNLLHRFLSLMKLHGALLAKGRLLAVQFIALFTEGLYLRIGQHADRLAEMLKEGLIAKGLYPYIDSPTNQQFFLIPNIIIDKLSEKVGFEYWGPRGETESIVRFVTDWSTTESEVNSLLELINV